MGEASLQVGHPPVVGILLGAVGVLVVVRLHRLASREPEHGVGRRRGAGGRHQVHDHAVAATMPQQSCRARPARSRASPGRPSSPRSPGELWRTPCWGRVDTRRPSPGAGSIRPLVWTRPGCAPAQLQTAARPPRTRCSRAAARAGPPRARPRSRRARQPPSPGAPSAGSSWPCETRFEPQAAHL